MVITNCSYSLVFLDDADRHENCLDAKYIVFWQIVDQYSLEAVEWIKGPVVFCIAAFFGKVRLIDNIEISLWLFIWIAANIAYHLIDS